MFFFKFLLLTSMVVIIISLMIPWYSYAALLMLQYCYILQSSCVVLVVNLIIKKTPLTQAFTAQKEKSNSIEFSKFDTCPLTMVMLRRRSPEVNKSGNPFTIIVLRVNMQG